MAALPVRSCLIDAEAIACSEHGLADFDLIRSYRHDHAVTPCTPGLEFGAPLKGANATAFVPTCLPEPEGRLILIVLKKPSR
jgi:hypothetical protein